MQLCKKSRIHATIAYVTVFGKNLFPSVHFNRLYYMYGISLSKIGCSDFESIFASRGQSCPINIVFINLLLFVKLGGKNKSF
jgi:hypothetical protein